MGIIKALRKNSRKNRFQKCIKCYSHRHNYFSVPQNAAVPSKASSFIPAFLFVSAQDAVRN